MRLTFFLAATLYVAGCSPEDTAKPRSPTGATGDSTSSSGSSSSGSSGSSSSGSSSSGVGGTGGSSGTGQGGAGVGGQTEPGPADLPCTQDLAFWSLGMTFAAPTPLGLAQGLNELAYDISTHPLSIVLAAKGGAGAATLGISSTIDNGMNLQIFPAGTKPTFVPALLSFGGFQTGSPQIKGTLHLVDAVGAVDIELNNIYVNAKTSAACSNVLAIVDAEIPPSETGKTLHLKAGDSTIGDLAAMGSGGGKDAGPLSLTLRAYFTGETMSFDFTSLK